MTDGTEDAAGSIGENIIESKFTTGVDAELSRRGGALTRTDISKAVIELPPFGATPIPCASGWGETPALLTFALHGARTDQY